VVVVSRLIPCRDLPTGFIVLEHDLYQQTVDLATGYTIPSAKAHQPPFNVRVGCLVVAYLFPISFLRPYMMS
jgi:hypothetical protein